MKGRKKTAGIATQRFGISCEIGLWLVGPVFVVLLQILNRRENLQVELVMQPTNQPASEGYYVVNVVLYPGSF